MLDAATSETVLKLVGENLSVLAAVSRTGKKAIETLRAKSEKSLSAYYRVASEKYGLAKTLLYRNEPVRLYEFYVPVELTAGPKVLQTTHVSIPLAKSPHLVITGGAGSGKSTLMRHFFLDALNTGSHLPLFFELRNLNDSPRDSLIQSLLRSLRAMRLSITAENFAQLLKGGKFLILLDAFDELTAERANAVQDEIGELRDEFGQNAIVVSSRADDRFVGWHGFHEVGVRPFTKGKTLELVEKLRYDPDTKAAFAAAIEGGLYETHQSFLQNPLLTTLMLMTYDQFGDIPTKMHLFYQQAFDTLYAKHDATKSGYRREMHTDLAADDFEDVLSAFAIVTYLHRVTEFTADEAGNYLEAAKRLVGSAIPTFETHAYLKDLNSSLCILLQEGLQYVYAHRSFQEYFAARYLTRTSPQQRQAIMTEYVRTIASDQVLKLVWEIDRRATEDDFIIPYLRDLAAKTKYDRDHEATAALAFLSRTVDGVGVDLDMAGWTYWLGTNANFKDHVVVEAIADLYKNPYNPNQVRASRAFVKALEDHYDVVVDDDVVITVVPESEISSGWTVKAEQLLEDDGIRTFFETAVLSMASAYVSTMRVLADLQEHRRINSVSVNELLFGPRK